MPPLLRSILLRSTIFRRPVLRVQKQSFSLGSAGKGSKGIVILSAFAGGATATVLCGYALYHLSGLKDVVNAIRHPIEHLKHISQSPTIDQAEATMGLFAALHRAAKAHVVLIPGADIVVDLAFNEIEKVVEAHKNEAYAFLKAAFEEMHKIVEIRGAGSVRAAWDILVMLRARLSQIQALATTTHQDAIGSLFGRLPGFGEHASGRVLGVYRKGLEKGKNVLLDVSRTLSTPPSGSVQPAAVEEAIPGAHPQMNQPDDQNLEVCDA